MSNKSIVCWAPPNEISAISYDKEKMLTNNLVKTRLILDKILDHINSGDKVGVKLHFGEAHNTRYLRHDYIREVVEAIKSKGGIPTLIETQGLGMYIKQISISENYSVCLGHRKTKADHEKIAHLHGFSESIIGAPIKFIDGEKGIESKVIRIDGIHFKEVPVAAGLFEYDKIIVASHFKGHPQAAFGGALKQLGVGCVTKHNKYALHFIGDLSINTNICNVSKCSQECIKACPVNAIKIENESAVIANSLCVYCIACLESCPVSKAINSTFNTNENEFNIMAEKVVDNATAVINSFGPENIRFVNFAFDIPLMCDCVVNANMPIIPDLGIFGSVDPVAIDKACIDAEINAPGLPILKEDGQWTEPISIGIEKINAWSNYLDTSWQLDAAVKNQLGSIEYELVKI